MKGFNDIKWDMCVKHDGKQYFIGRVHTAGGDGLAVWTDGTPPDIAVVFGHEYKGATIAEIVKNGIMRELLEDTASWKREPDLIDSATGNDFSHIPMGT